MTTSRVIALILVFAIGACAAPALGLFFLNETFFHGFSAICADGYPRDTADEVSCVPSWGAGLPYLAGTLVVATAAAGALWQLLRGRGVASS